MWMKKRSQQIFEEPEMLVIEGETYERQDLQFDQLTDENGVVRFHISGQQPVPDCRYMLYDKVAQGVLWLENATMEAQWLSFTYQEIVKPVYEDGINLYTLLAVNKKEKCAYTFCYTKETKANAYDRMGNILHKDDLGKAWDGQNMDAVLYIAEKNKMLRLLVQKEYLFLKAFLDAKVETVNMKKDTVILHVSLQDYGYRITRIYMQLRSKTEERTYDFGIRTRKERGAYHLTAQIHLKDLQMAQFYWDIKADTEKDGIVRAIELKNHEKWMHRIMYLQQMHYVYADGNIVYPYKTKSRNIALHFRQKTEQDCWAFIMKEYLALAIY
jgi:hypothetical protein